MEHITFECNGVVISGDCRTPATRVNLLIPYSKTDQFGSGVFIDIDEDPGDPLCVAAMFNRLRAMRPSHFAAPNGEARLFTTSNGKVLHRNKVHALLKGVASRFDYNPAGFSSHSLRAGGASAMYHNGFSVEEIRRRGRWVSDVWKVYIQGYAAEAADITQRMCERSLIVNEQTK